MKKYLLYVLMGAITITFYGCPVGSSYPLGKPGTEKIDKALIGTWEAVGDPAELAVVKVSIKKKDNYSYNVDVLETGETYSADDQNFIGWITELDGKTFLYVQGRNNSSYYLYHYEIKSGKLVSHDVGLLVGGKDAITSTEAYRKEVSESLKLPDCLSEEIVWNEVK